MQKNHKYFQSIFSDIRNLLNKIDSYMNDYVSIIIDQIEAERRERTGERG